MSASTTQKHQIDRLKKIKAANDIKLRKAFDEVAEQTKFIKNLAKQIELLKKGGAKEENLKTLFDEKAKANALLLDARIDKDAATEIKNKIAKLRKRAKDLKIRKKNQKIAQEKYLKDQENYAKEQEKYLKDRESSQKSSMKLQGILHKLDVQYLKTLSKKEANYEKALIQMRDAQKTFEPVIEKQSEDIKGYYKSTTELLENVIQSVKNDPSLNNLKTNSQTLLDQKEILEQLYEQTAARDLAIQQIVETKKTVDKDLEKAANPLRRMGKFAIKQEGNLLAIISGVVAESPILAWGVKALYDLTESQKEIVNERTKLKQKLLEKQKEIIKSQQEDEKWKEKKIKRSSRRGGRRQRSEPGTAAGAENVSQKQFSAQTKATENATVKEHEAEADKLETKLEDKKGTDGVRQLSPNVSKVAKSSFSFIDGLLVLFGLKEGAGGIGGLFKMFKKIGPFLKSKGTSIGRMLPVFTIGLIGSVTALYNLIEGFTNATKWGMGAATTMISSTVLPLLGAMAGSIFGFPGMVAGFAAGALAQALLPEKWKIQLSAWTGQIMLGLKTLVLGCEMVVDWLINAFHVIGESLTTAWHWFRDPISRWDAEIEIWIQKKLLYWESLKFWRVSGWFGDTPETLAIKAKIKASEEKLKKINSDATKRELESAKRKEKWEEQKNDIRDRRDEIRDERDEADVAAEKAYAKAEEEDLKRIKEKRQKKQNEKAGHTAKAAVATAAAQSIVQSMGGRGKTKQNVGSFNSGAPVNLGDRALGRAGGVAGGAGRAMAGGVAGAGAGGGAVASGAMAEGAPISGGSFETKAPQVMARLQKDLGISKEDAAAIVGNLGHESAGMQSDINEKGKGGGGGYGWAQWTGVRRKQFEQYAKANGLDPKSDEANYQFMVNELQGSEKGALKKLQGAGTLQEKTIAFEKAYERAGVKSYGSRYSYAQKAKAAADAAAQQGTLGGGATSGTGAEGSNAGLRVKGGMRGQAFAGGKTEAGTTELAANLQKNLPGYGIATGFNDTFHANRPGKHGQGLAMDYTLKDPKGSAAAKAATERMLSAAGAKGYVQDEYTNPSPGSTGGHIHAQFSSKEDAEIYNKFYKQQAAATAPGIPASDGTRKPDSRALVPAKDSKAALQGIRQKFDSRVAEIRARPAGTAAEREQNRKDLLGAMEERDSSARTVGNAMPTGFGATGATGTATAAAPTISPMAAPTVSRPAPDPLQAGRELAKKELSKQPWGAVEGMPGVKIRSHTRNISQEETDALNRDPETQRQIAEALGKEKQVMAGQKPTVPAVTGERMGGILAKDSGEAVLGRGPVSSGAKTGKPIPSGMVPVVGSGKYNTPRTLISGQKTPIQPATTEYKTGRGLGNMLQAEIRRNGWDKAEVKPGKAASANAEMQKASAAPGGKFGGHGASGSWGAGASGEWSEKPAGTLAGGAAQSSGQAAIGRGTPATLQVASSGKSAGYLSAQSSAATPAPAAPAAPSPGGASTGSAGAPPPPSGGGAAAGGAGGGSGAGGGAGGRAAPRGNEYTLQSALNTDLSGSFA